MRPRQSFAFGRTLMRWPVDTGRLQLRSRHRPTNSGKATRSGDAGHPLTDARVVPRRRGRLGLALRAFQPADHAWPLNDNGEAMKQLELGTAAALMLSAGHATATGSGSDQGLVHSGADLAPVTRGPAWL